MRQKQAQAPGDDFAEEAEALELLDFGVAESGEFDALGAHDRRDAKPKSAAKCNRRRAGKQKRDARLAAESCRAAVEIEGGAKVRNFGYRDQACR